MTRLTSKEICYVLDNLIQNVEPVGDSIIDKERMSNLKTLIDVTNWCLDGMNQIIHYRHSFEGSVRDIGETAFSCLMEYKAWLEEVEKEE